MKNNNLIDFGRSLKKARTKAGYHSLSTCIEAIKESNGSIVLSRASLNLIENGRIDDINADFLKALCELYAIDYLSKLKEYLAIRYSLPKTFFKEENFIQKSSKETLTIGVSSKQDSLIEIIPLEKFKKLQSELSDNSIVWVSVINFIDDSTFFDLVLENIKRGIRYYYYIPEESELQYRRFISMLSEKLNMTSDEIDNKKCFFVKRGVSEFPIIGIIFITSDKKVEGFVGLSSGDKTDYFQKADALLSWRLYQSFLMAFFMSLDSELYKRRKQFSKELEGIDDIQGFPVLMRSMGI